MNKLIMSFIGILLILSLAKADVVKTTTGYIWTNITFDNRTLVDWDYYIPNATYCGTTCDRTVVASNLERNKFFLVFRVIPKPRLDCFDNYENCPFDGFDTKILVNYSRPAYVGLFNKYTSNWGGAQVDILPCWNWWNTSDTLKQMAQQRVCPTVAIKVDKEAESCNIFWSKSSVNGATPNYIARLEGFSINYVDIDTQVSPPFMRFVNSLVIFQGITLDIWKIFYYTIAVILIIIDLVLVIGVFPLGLRWVVKKVTGD